MLVTVTRNLKIIYFKWVTYNLRFRTCWFRSWYVRRAWQFLWIIWWPSSQFNQLSYKWFERRKYRNSMKVYSILLLIERTSNIDFITFSSNSESSGNHVIYKIPFGFFIQSFNRSCNCRYGTGVLIATSFGSLTSNRHFTWFFMNKIKTVSKRFHTEKLLQIK